MRTPTSKRGRSSSSREDENLNGLPSSGNSSIPAALKTPKNVLDQYRGMKRHSTSSERSKILQAINSCIITAATSVELEEDAFETLEDLLELEVNLNETDTSILDKIGGPPLYLASKLNVPRAVRLLCENGASVTFSWDSHNPIEVCCVYSILEICNFSVIADIFRARS